MSPQRASKTVERSQARFHFDRREEPAIRVDPGERVLVQTWDCFSNRVTSASQTFAEMEDLRTFTGGFNPIAGPIFVTGAEPGDTLIVDIEEIRLGTVAPFAVTVAVPGAGGICGSGGSVGDIRPDTRICPIEADGVVFPTAARELRLPLRPMIGTIGTAPGHEVIGSLKFGREHCGNVDCPDITTGARVHLPVNVEGALLSLGDVHAAMGDAELTGIALETSADVTIRVDLADRASRSQVRLPMVETAANIGVLGCDFGHPVGDNIKTAASALLHEVRARASFTPEEALELLGATAIVRVNQCVRGGWNAVLVSVPRSILAT